MKNNAQFLASFNNVDRSRYHPPPRSDRIPFLEDSAEAGDCGGQGTSLFLLHNLVWSLEEGHARVGEDQGRAEHFACVWQDNG